MPARIVSLIGMVASCLVLVFYVPLASADIFDVSSGSELWDALQDAAANGEDDIINLAEGVYDQYHPDPYVQYAMFQWCSTEPVPRSLTIQGGPGTNPGQVILDGHGYGYVLKIFDGTSADSSPPDPLPSINIIGLTIRNGDEAFDPGGLNVHSYFHHVTVKNCRIVDNTSNAGHGGGAYIFNRLGELVFENNLVTGNRLYERDITTSHGPEIQCEGAGVHFTHQGEAAIVRNNIIANNTAEGYHGTGGGLFLSGWRCGSSGRTWHLVNNSIVNNAARYGGGVLVSLYGSLYLHNNIIHTNDSPVPDSDPSDLMVAERGDSDTVHAYHNDFSRVSSILDDDVGNIDFDPAFVGFYHLPAGSPLVDAGTDMVPSSLPASDYDGDPRTCLAMPDMGAQEWCREAGAPAPIRKTGMMGVRCITRRNNSEAINRGIGVSIDSSAATFSAGESMPIICERSDGGLNSPRMLLVDAIDYHTVYDIPDHDTGGPATRFQTNWVIDPSIPPGEYKIYVEQPDLVWATPASIARPERAQQIKPCHGYSQTFSIRNINAVGAQRAPLITITQPVAGGTYRTNELLDIAWQNSNADPYPNHAYSRVLLKNGVELDRIEPINYAGRSLEDVINLYEYLSGSDYQIKIEMYCIEDTEQVFVTSATSDYFNLQNYFDLSSDVHSFHPLVVYSPEGGTFRHGEVLPIKWRFYRPFSDMKLRVSLVRGSTSGGGEWLISDSTWASCSNRGDCDEPEGVDFYWTLPDTIPAGDGYRVYVEQIGGAGVSLSVAPFAIE